MKIERVRLLEIVDGAKPTRAEMDAMAAELIAIRDEDAKRDDGTVAVKIEHAAKEGINGWFAPRQGRLPRSLLHVGSRFSMTGRVYAIVAIDGDHVRVR